MPECRLALYIGLPDLVNKNSKYPFKFEFQVSSHQCLKYKVPHAVFGMHLYYFFFSFFLSEIHI